MKATVYANAKINFSLDITSVLPNGYHALDTVMQSVTLRDTVTVTVGEPGLTLVCDAPGVPTDGRNTAMKAAALFYEAAGTPPAAAIRIEKRIPSEAGLGGGSADAAAVLRALNQLYDCPLPESTLLTLAARVGADVPFCLTGGTALCKNVGEVMAPLPGIRAHVVLAKPTAGVSTAAAYRRFDAGEALPHPDNDKVLFYLARGEAEAAARYASNVFRFLSPLPDYDALIGALKARGAFHAEVSGSGSAVFGLFAEEAAARLACDALQKKVPFCVLCETADTGAELRESCR